MGTLWVEAVFAGAGLPNVFHKVAARGHLQILVAQTESPLRLLHCPPLLILHLLLRAALEDHLVIWKSTTLFD